jgi:hypothetical protein
MTRLPQGNFHMEYGVFPVQERASRRVSPAVIILLLIALVTAVLMITVGVGSLVLVEDPTAKIGVPLMPSGR